MKGIPYHGLWQGDKCNETGQSESRDEDPAADKKSNKRSHKFMWSVDGSVWEFRGRQSLTKLTISKNHDMCTVLNKVRR